MTSLPENFSVCLIRPPAFTTLQDVGQDATPPIGLAYLAAAVRAAGHPVTVVDGIGEAIHQYSAIPGYDEAYLHGLTFAELIERVPADSRVIGVSCMFSSQWVFIKDIFPKLRARCPDAVIVLGGEHATACPEYVLNNTPEVDVCVLGEGEETFVELIAAVAQTRPMDTIAGVALRGADGIVRTQPRNRLTDIDAIPAPAWDLFPLETYIDNAFTYGTNHGRSMPVLASRGCPYACTFCSSEKMWTRRWLARDPALLLEEMKGYMARYRVSNFDFYDLTAIVDRNWIIRFCNLIIEQDLDITWQLPSGTRSEALDPEVVRLLRDSGCRNMNYAPESGSVPELKRIKKMVNLDRMLESIRAASRMGIEVKCNFIFGMPGADWSDVRRTLRYIVRIAVAGCQDISAFPYLAYPGTAMFDGLAEEKKVAVSDDYLKRLAVFTDIGKSVSVNDRFSARTLGRLCFGAMALFYGVSWLCRPWRPVRFAYHYMKRDTSNRLNFALANVRRKAALRRLRGDTVTLEPSFRPQELL